MTPPKVLPPGRSYACPWCGSPMQPHDGPWDLLHCTQCSSSVDLWDPSQTDRLKVIDAPTKPLRPVTVVMHLHRKLKSWWKP